jgi:hypothetical protein
METASPDSFVVILFSYTQQNIYAENVPSEFRNQLARPLKLGSEWEVALMDVHFMHNFDNFLKDIKFAVLLHTPREEHSAKSLRMYAQDGDRYEIKNFTQQLANLDKPQQIKSNKSIVQYVTALMLKQKGIRLIQTAIVIVKEGTRYRRFDALPHFLEISLIQRFEQTVAPCENYSWFVFVNIESGYNHTTIMPKSRMIDPITNEIKFPIEGKRTILKRIIKRNPDMYKEFYSYLLPVEEGVKCKKRLVENNEPKEKEGDNEEPTHDVSCDGGDKLERIPAMSDIASNAQEIGEYSEVYNNSLRVTNINQSEAPSSSSSSETKDPTPWFADHVKQFQNKLNEEQIEYYVSSNMCKLNRGYFQTMTEFCKHFVKEINRASCKDGDSLNFNYSEMYGTLEFTTSERFTSIHIICDSNYLSSVLGITPVMEVCTNGRDSELSYVYQFPCKSILPPRLDFVHSFVVYSDVCEFVLTGGTETQHLARFPVRGESGQHVAYVANPPSYLPVRSTEVPSIYINLVDYYGNNLPFSRRHINVVSVKLHFRKRT